MFRLTGLVAHRTAPHGDAVPCRQPGECMRGGGLKQSRSEATIRARLPKVDDRAHRPTTRRDECGDRAHGDALGRALDPAIDVRHPQDPDGARQGERTDRSAPGCATTISVRSQEPTFEITGPDDGAEVAEGGQPDRHVEVDGAVREGGEEEHRQGGLGGDRCSGRRCGPKRSVPTASRINSGTMTATSARATARYRSVTAPPTARGGPRSARSPARVQAQW